MYSSSRGDPDVRCAEVRGWMSEKPGTNFFFFLEIRMELRNNEKERSRATALDSSLSVPLKLVKSFAADSPSFW